ncbi:MAG: polysaccharide biosynthesis C-terminal domain-containing protein, partial [Planctomycetales bacterium]|nr:polysaccharide biosynthesis C-terminal domain-containing protein [Planctomycetales bacterium]
LAASLLTALAGGVLYARSPGDSLAVALLAASILSPLYTLHEFARAASFTHFKVRSVLAIDLSTLVLQALLLFAMWAFDAMTITGVYLVIALSCLPPLAVWAWAWREQWSLDNASFRQDCREIWQFSRWLVLARTMGQGSRLIIPWLVYAMLSEAAAGRLAICLSLTGLAWLFVRGLNTFFRPFIVQAFSQGGPAALSRAVLWTSLTQTLLLLPVLLLFVFASDPVMELIYKKSFPAATMLLVLLTLNTLATSWAIATATGLLALDRPSSNLWIEGATLLLTLVLSAPLILVSGLEGAAWAMLAGNVAGAGMAYWMFQRELARVPAAQETPA